MAEIEVDGTKVHTEIYYQAEVNSSFIDTSGLAWCDLSIKDLPTFGLMKIYFHCGTFEEEPFRNINLILPKGLKVQVKVRSYDLQDVREKTEYDRGWRLKVTSAQVNDQESRKKLENLNHKPAKNSKSTRIKVIPEGDETIRATYDSFHSKDIQTFNESGKLGSQPVRMTGSGKFTLVDLSDGSVLSNGGQEAEDVSLFMWDTNQTGIESLGIRFMGSRELSLRLVHAMTGEVISFKLRKV